MQATITNKLLKSLKPANKPYDVRDTNLKGFIVRVNISGKLVYMCEYARAKRIMLGQVGIMSLTVARDKAKDVINDARNGIDPKKKREEVRGKKDPSEITLNDFVIKHYEPWVITNNPSGKETVSSLKSRFCKKLGNKTLAEINTPLLEEWCTERRKSVEPETINRNIASLRSALNKAVEWHLLEANEMSTLKPLKTKLDPIVRYLTKEEEQRLRATLKERNNKLKSSRKIVHQNTSQHNLTKITFADYLYPMTLLSINTGIRRGELFRLTWEDILFDLKSLRAKSRKSKRSEYVSRYIPLNSEALTALKAWHEQQPIKTGLVFVNEETGKAFTTIKKAWSTVRNTAKLENFRWHDFRHHFASQLVMAGVDLNTVRELMGHADIKMTLRYAHLAPEHKAEAVERIINKGT